MKVLKEITEWKTDYSVPNHIYLVDGDKILAYKTYRENSMHFLTGSCRLDKRGRKFKELKYIATDWGTTQTKSNVIIVQGSKGNTYEVDPDTGTCSCPGFQYRGNCKHVKILQETKV